MSNVRTKFMAAETTDELERVVNEFLAKDEIEVKQTDFQTDGYEKPYAIMILYHQKGGKGDES